MAKKRFVLKVGESVEIVSKDRLPICTITLDQDSRYLIRGPEALAFTASTRPTGPRLRAWAPISISEFKEQVVAAGTVIGGAFNPEALTGQLYKDIKVSFSLENMVEEAVNDDDWFHGLHTTDSGFTYWGMSAGGDWEVPVRFLLYWDGKRVRAYVPTEGNLWNTTTRQAYGNDEEADVRNRKKRWPHLGEVAADDFDPTVHLPDVDEEALKADICARFGLGDQG